MVTACLQVAPSLDSSSELEILVCQTIFNYLTSVRMGSPSNYLSWNAFVYMADQQIGYIGQSRRYEWWLVFFASIAQSTWSNTSNTIWTRVLIIISIMHYQWRIFIVITTPLRAGHQHSTGGRCVNDGARAGAQLWSAARRPVSWGELRLCRLVGMYHGERLSVSVSTRRCNTAEAA